MKKSRKKQYQLLALLIAIGVIIAGGDRIMKIREDNAVIAQHNETIANLNDPEEIAKQTSSFFKAEQKQMELERYTNQLYIYFGLAAFLLIVIVLLYPTDRKTSKQKS